MARFFDSSSSWCSDMDRPAKKVRPQRFCIFCGKPGLSKEHIFAEWLHPYLPKTEEVNHTSRTVVMQMKHDETHERLRSGEGHSGTVRVVCKSCNNGWMSALQVQVKPLLLPMVLGEPVRLFTKHQTILAAWIAMFVMVVEHRVGDSRVVAVSPRERLDFMTTKQTPKSWKIWIGRYDREKWGPIITHTTAEIASDTHNGAYPPGDHPVSPNTHATTFVVGKLFIHVFGSVFPRVVRQKEIAREAMPRIWPIRDSPVIWPTEITLIDRDADDIAFAFANRLRSIRDDQAR